MDHTVTVLDWMALPLLVPCALILLWKIVSDKLKGNRLSSALISVSLNLSFVVIGVTALNIERGVIWLRWVLLVAQLLLLVLLAKRLWLPFMQKLRK